MAEVRDVVALLHRADWTRLSLSAELYQEHDRGLTHQLRRTRSANIPEPAAEDVPAGVHSDSTTLRIAPGGRFREEPGDQDSGPVRGSDGVSGWVWFPSGSAPRPGLEAISGDEPPCPRLLLPSWLLSGYTLTVSGGQACQGRDAIVVTAARRPVLCAPGPHLSRHLGDKADLLVDAELGILLRCEETFAGERFALAELTALVINAAEAADQTQYAPPPGSIPVQDVRESLRRVFSDPGWDVPKAIAGLAAGGLGAIVRHGPRQPRPGAEDDTEAAMPLPDTDRVPPLDPVAAEAEQPGDEVLYLLYRSGAVPAITATVHEWQDVAAIAALVPDGARSIGHGGLGYLLDSVTGKVATTHVVVRVRVADADRYRFDYLGQPGTRGDKTIASDGQRRWQRLGDKVITGQSTRPPEDIAGLIDASWLLDCRLSGGPPITYRGRAAYQLRVVRAPDAPPDSPLRFLPVADAIVDAEFGCLLRLISYAGAVPGSWRELTEISVASDPGDFAIPAGLRVTEETGNPIADQAATMPGATGTVIRTAAEVAKRTVDAAATARRFLRGTPTGS